ncbi:hypothetical protein AKJ08_0096 [Vulgatibacter incomptus]|uniref:DUF5666 domain-containing protein n=1 Tax=Vulgatibacter incomptus TaxID=1391653 RepID=A0A0K1P9E8_9BACT|nr:hypothetical protein AKJ08_0096 [Vulgatibacter incomptus]
MAAGTHAIDARNPSSRVQQKGGNDQQGDQQGPIEILIVQGYVKSIDGQSITLTAPGAKADLPLRLVPDTRFIQEEKDIARTDVHEGQLVRAALVPMGDDLLAVVVELVPDEGADQSKPNEAPPSQAPNAGPPSAL